jgi:hypothetical protein
MKPIPEFTGRFTIAFHPTVWALPEPKQTAVSAAYHRTATARDNARRRRELWLLTAAEDRLRISGRIPTVDDINREALAMHETLEALDAPRLTPADADAIDKMRDAGRLRF